MTTSDGIAGSTDDLARERDALRKAKGRSFRRLLPPFALVALLASAGAATFPRWSDTFYELSNSLSLGQGSPQVPIVADEQAQAERFFAQQALPILEETARKNQDAIARALDTLGDSIDNYRQGIDPFIADLRSWSTTYHIFLKSFVGWWHGDEALANYVDGRFRRHVFSGESIAGNVRNALVELDEDLEANQNQLLVNLRNASASSRYGRASEVADDRGLQHGGVSARPRRNRASSESLRRLQCAGVLGCRCADRYVASGCRGRGGKDRGYGGDEAAATTASETVLAEGGSSSPTRAAAARWAQRFRSSAMRSDSASGSPFRWWPSVTRRSCRTRSFDELNGYIDGLKAALVGDRGTPSELSKGMKAYVREIDRGEADLVKQAIMEAGKQP